MKLQHILACSALALSVLSVTSTAMASTSTAADFGSVDIAVGKAVSTDDGSYQLARRGRGADDKGSDNRRGDRGRGRGADDKGNDDRGGDRGRGRGSDDNGPNQT